MSYDPKHLSAALEWIERNVGSARDYGTFVYGDGIRLVARALSETSPASPGASPGADDGGECWYCEQPSALPAVPNTCVCRCHAAGHPSCAAPLPEDQGGGR